MKYSEVVELLKNKELEPELKYYSDGTIGGDKYTLHWNEEKNGECEARLHHNTIKKLFETFDYKFRPYAIEGNEEVGWVIIYLIGTL